MAPQTLRLDNMFNTRIVSATVQDVDYEEITSAPINPTRGIRR
ncbi:putative tail tape measure protein [Salmonella phage 41]|nr:putative tail tape measure protein [Salmonella phage 41]